jgi:hypothetical protein
MKSRNSSGLELVRAPINRPHDTPTRKGTLNVKCNTRTWEPLGDGIGGGYPLLVHEVAITHPGGRANSMTRYQSRAY